MPPRRRTSVKRANGNCLYVFFVWPFVLAFQVIGLLLKGIVWLLQKATATPESRRFSLIVVAGVGFMGLMSAAISAVAGIISRPTPTQTVDVAIAIQDTAQAQAFMNFTQTALAWPTETASSIPATNTAFSASATETNLPTLTTFPTNTAMPLPTATIVVILPTLPPPPAAEVCSCAGDTLNCGDFGSHASAQACYNYCVSQGRGDIHRLDRDGDGSACES